MPVPLGSDPPPPTGLSPSRRARSASALSAQEAETGPAGAAQRWSPALPPLSRHQWQRLAYHRARVPWSSPPTATCARHRTQAGRPHTCRRTQRYAWAVDHVPTTSGVRHLPGRRSRPAGQVAPAIPATDPRAARSPSTPRRCRARRDGSWCGPGQVGHRNPSVRPSAHAKVRARTGHSRRPQRATGWRTGNPCRPHRQRTSGHRRRGACLGSRARATAPALDPHREGSARIRGCPDRIRRSRRAAARVRSCRRRSRPSLLPRGRSSPWIASSRAAASGHGRAPRWPVTPASVRSPGRGGRRCQLGSPAGALVRLIPRRRPGRMRVCP